jgi:SH3-like domain-containing protein
LVTLFAVYTIGLVYKIQKEENSAISLSESEVKFEPRLEATTYFKLSVGEQVKILNGEQEWLKIRRSDGKMGWVEKKMLEKI